jgi:AraC-like DNA-binding protein
MKKKPTIPIHTLQQADSPGLQIKRFAGIGRAGIYQKAAHRDDHYLFYWQEKGRSSMMIDFKTMSLTTGNILCIFPGQVHHGVTADKSYAWAISLESQLLSDTYRPALEEFILQQKPFQLSVPASELLHRSILLLDRFYQLAPGLHFSQQVIRGAIDACIGVFASACREQAAQHSEAGSRPFVITRQFRKLLSRSFKTVKSPSAYAAALNISQSYLNEAVKQVSGFPVSYWIQQQIITEAKRILYYTDDSIREVAYALGYEDHTYFSRLFNKVEGVSPARFRENSRK